MLQKFIRHSKVKITVYDTLGAFISLLSIYKKKTDLFRYRLPQSNDLIQCCMQYHEYHIVSSSGHELELCSSSCYMLAILYLLRGRCTTTWTQFLQGNAHFWISNSPAYWRISAFQRKYYSPESLILPSSSSFSFRKLPKHPYVFCPLKFS